MRGWLFITMGRSHRQFLYDLVARPLVVLGFFVGIWWGGIYGLALTYGILSTVLLIPGFYFAIRHTFVRASDILFPVVRPLIFALLAFGSAFAATRSVDLIPILELIVGVAAGGAVLLPLLLIPAYRRDIAQILGFVTQMRKPKPRATESDDPKHAADSASEQVTHEQAQTVEAVLLHDASSMGDVLDAARTADELENRGTGAGAGPGQRREPVDESPAPTGR